MTKRLGEHDAHAVDLLLDKSRAARKGNGGRSVFVAPVGDSVAKRVGAAESVLRLLAEFPATDPPADLALKTIQRINGQAALTPQPAVEGHPLIGEGPQHA